MLKKRRMLPIITGFFIFLAVCGSFFLFHKYHTTILFIEYDTLWYYRRMHPDMQSDPKVVRVFDAGHTTTYADSIWLSTVQYIADNIRNNEYTVFLNPLVDTITELHPHFTRPYILSVLLAPTVNPESMSFLTGNIDIGKHALTIGEKGMTNTCDREKLDAIKSLGIAGKPWENSELKNPCTTGELAYQTAYLADQLGEREKAYEYYTIASANSDAPEASRFLALITKGKAGDRIDVALQFLLIASSGYDESPFICQEKALDIIGKLQQRTISSALIQELQMVEKILEKPKDTKNPLASSTTNCHDSTNRAIKQLYLEYITEATRGYPEIQKGDELLEKKILSEIPTPLSNSGYTIIRKSDGNWEYRMRL